MQVTLYKTTADKRRFNKYLQQVNVLTCEPTDPLDVKHPVLKVVSSQAYISQEVNYVYIPDFERYYFIDRMEFDGRILNLYLSVDVIQSFKSEILAHSATIKRNENFNNGYLVDEKYNVYSYEEVLTKSFPSGMTNDSIILITV
jgi:hypothetical protein